MSKIPASILPPNLTDRGQNTKSGKTVTDFGDFDALLFKSGSNTNGSGSADILDLSSIGNTFTGFIDAFVQRILDAAKQNYSDGMSTSDVPNKYPFTAEFDATFGTSGPLPVFITLMTAKLDLDAAHNQAFQEIAVRNKDIVKTPESVAKLAMELQQAGIG